MANLPISQLPEITTAPEGGAALPIVQDGVTSRIQISNLVGPYITTGSLGNTQTIKGFLQWYDNTDTLSGYIASYSTEVGSIFLRSANNTNSIAVYNNGISLVGNVTASNNISASGYISASQIRTPAISAILGTFGLATTTVGDNVSSSGFILANNITASGTVSASGTIFANRYMLRGVSIFNNPIFTGFMTASNISASGYITANNITSSGNISASGTIIANSISSSNSNFSGTISASNISASGWISGSDLVITNNSILGNTSNLDNVRITGSLYVSGSNIRFDNETNYNGIEFTGSTDFSRDVTVRDDLFVKDETTLDREVTIGYNGLSNSNFSYQLNVSASSNHVNSANFDGGIGITGSISASGNISASATINGNNIIAANQIQGNDLDVVTFGYIGDYLEVNNSITSSIISASGKLFGGLANTITPSAVYYNPIGGELSYGTGFTAAGISGSWQGQNFISASQITGNLPSGTVSSSNQITSSYSNLSAATVSGSWQGQNFISASQVTASSTAGRVVYTGAGGILQTEAGFAYDATNDRLTVSKITTTEFTSSFVTSSQVFSSGSNFLGDDTTDKQTLVGTVVMTGSAELTGSLDVNEMVSATTISASLTVISNLVAATGTISSTDNIEAPQITGSKGLLIQKSNGEGNPTAGTSNLAIFQNNNNDQDASISIVAADSKKSQLHFGKHDSIDVGGIRYFHEDDSTAPDVMKFRTKGTNIATLWRGAAGNQSYFGVGTDITSGELPTDYYTAQGTLSGGGLLLSSSNGTGIIIDRGANTGLGTIKFKTDGFHIWTLGNINGDNDDNFYIYNSGNTSDKAISLISGSNSTKFHTNVTASGNISASGNIKAGLSSNSTSNTVFYNDTTGELTYGTAATGNVTAASVSGSFLLNTSDTLTGDLNVTNHITASGNISASGNIITNFISSSNSSVRISSNLTASNNLVVTNDSIFNGKSFFEGALTASHAISSSGAVYAKQLYISGSKRILWSNTTGGTNNLVIPDTGLVVLGRMSATTISASQEISSSGNITGLRGNFSGNVGIKTANNASPAPLTVEGAISASGAFLGGSSISASGAFSANIYTTQHQSLTSAGSAAGSATAISATGGGVVFATVGGASQGFILPALNTVARGSTFTIHNVSATAVKIYPPSAGFIYH